MPHQDQDQQSMPHPTTAADHAAHDPLLVAAYAAGDAAGAQLDEAAGLVATCAACASLHRDLRAIALALPATAASAPSPRPRDFRLTAEQAASLRPVGWRRLLAPLAGPSFAFARPLGTGLATIGLAGIIVAGASGIPLGAGGAAAPAGTAGDASVEMLAAPAAGEGAGDLPVAGAAATEAPAADGGPAAIPQPSAAPAGGERAGDGTGSGDGGEVPKNSAGALESAGAPLVSSDEPLVGYQAVPPAAPVSPMSAIAAAGVLALALGVMLLTLRWTARRIA